MKTEYPNNLATFREKRGLTVTELAVEMGLSHSTLYKWESGERFPKNSRIMMPIIEQAYQTSKEALWPTVYGKS